MLMILFPDQIHSNHKKNGTSRLEVTKILTAVRDCKVLNEGLEKYPLSDKLNTYKGGWYYDQANYTLENSWKIPNFTKGSIFVL